MITIQNESDFYSACRGNLQDAIEWINRNLPPKDVFDKEKLIFMNNENNLTYIGSSGKWKVYENSEGFMEGYMAVGAGKGISGDDNKDVRRVVTNQTTLEGFEKYVRGLRKTNEIKDVVLKPSKLPALPFAEQ